MQNGYRWAHPGRRPIVYRRAKIYPVMNTVRFLKGKDFSMRLRMNPRLGEPAEGNLSFMFSQEWLGFATDEEKIFSKKILDFVTKGKALASWMLMLMLVVRQGKYRRRANSLLAFKSYDVHHYIADQALDRKPIQSYFSILHGIVGDFPSLIVDIAAVDIPELTKAVESVD